MATYSPRPLKNGKVNWCIQICIKDGFGKSKFVCTTWDNPDNLTGTRMEKALYSFGENWEKQYRSGHTHRLSNATFKQVANVWLEARKHNISECYYLRAVECIDRMDKFFGNKLFVDLRAYDVQQFFIYLNNYKFKTSTAKIKPSKMERFNKIAEDYGIKKACREADFSRPTLYYARKGDNIAILSAKNICDKFGLDFNEYFEKTTIESGYRKESIMKYKRVLSAIFTYCISIELVNVNYASSNYLKNIIGGEPAKEINILTNAEYDALLNKLKEFDKEKDTNIFNTMPLYLMSMLGLRTCEVCGLEWQDIDFENRTLTVQRDRIYVKGMGIIRRDTKTKTSHRSLYICDALLNKLKEFKKIYDELRKKDKKFNRCGAIFCNTDGTPRFPRYLNHLLSKFLTDANCKQISCHKIRHSWITKLISEKIPVNVVSKMAGHANSDITLKIYTHYCKDVDNSKDVLQKIFS